MFMARLSTGSPVFKPIDNPASFADSFVTKVSSSHPSIHPSIHVDAHHSKLLSPPYFLSFKVLSYNYTYALNSWLLLNPWWLCFDWSMGCVSLLESFTDPRIVAVVLFWIAFGTLISYCFLAVEGPLKWYNLIIYSTLTSIITLGLLPYHWV